MADGLRYPRRFRMAVGARGKVTKGDAVGLSGFHGPGSKTTDEFFLGKELHGSVKKAVVRIMVRLIGVIVNYLRNVASTEACGDTGSCSISRMST